MVDMNMGRRAKNISISGSLEVTPTERTFLAAREPCIQTLFVECMLTMKTMYNMV